MVCAGLAGAQAVSGPSFDVISIKPTEGQPVNSGFHRASPGVLNATNVSVRFLIGWAYDLRDDQIAGGPGWLDTARFEILAKPGEGGDPKEAAKLVRARTQTLLAERFHLTFHKETRQGPVLVLVVGKNGPKGMKPSTAASTDWVENGHHLDGQRMSMDTFAHDFLARTTGRQVTNKTGIEGRFDIKLDWTPDDAPADAAASAQYPPLFGALEEQLGLKLEKDQGPIETLIVDHAERPERN